MCGRLWVAAAQRNAKTAGRRARESQPRNLLQRVGLGSRRRHGVAEHDWRPFFSSRFGARCGCFGVATVLSVAMVSLFSWRRYSSESLVSGSSVSLVIISTAFSSSESSARNGFSVPAPHRRISPGHRGNWPHTRRSAWRDFCEPLHGAVAGRSRPPGRVRRIPFAPPSWICDSITSRASSVGSITSSISTATSARKGFGRWNPFDA